MHTIKGLDASTLLWKPLYCVSEAEKIVLGIPFKNNAPDRLRRLFRTRFWSYDLERRADLFDQKIVDVGNVPFCTGFHATARRTANAIRALRELNPKARFVFLGGNHCITLMTAAALKPKTLLSLDAHADLCDEYAGDRNSCACVMKRLLDDKIKVKLRGVRSACAEEHALLRKLDWKTKLDFKGKTDYLSIDIDVLDSSLANAEWVEAMGASVEQVVQQVRKARFKHADLVEWVPDRGYPAVISILKELLWA